MYVIQTAAVPSHTFHHERHRNVGPTIDKWYLRGGYLDSCHRLVLVCRCLDSGGFGSAWSVSIEEKAGRDRAHGEASRRVRGRVRRVIPRSLWQNCASIS